MLDLRQVQTLLDDPVALYGRLTSWRRRAHLKAWQDEAASRREHLLACVAAILHVGERQPTDSPLAYHLFDLLTLVYTWGRQDERRDLLAHLGPTEAVAGEAHPQPRRDGILDLIRYWRGQRAASVGSRAPGESEADATYRAQLIELGERLPALWQVRLVYEWQGGWYEQTSRVIGQLPTHALQRALQHLARERDAEVTPVLVEVMSHADSLRAARETHQTLPSVPPPPP